MFLLLFMFFMHAFNTNDIKKLLFINYLHLIIHYIFRHNII